MRLLAFGSRTFDDNDAVCVALSGFEQLVMPDVAVGFVDGVEAKGRPTSRGSGDTWDRLQAAGVLTYLVLRANGNGKR